MKAYKATCLNQFFWNDKIYRQNDSIIFHEDDLQTLNEAKLIGDIRAYEPTGQTEYAVKEPAEEAMIEHGPRKRGRRRG